MATLSDDEHLRQFEDQCLPLNQLNHRAHLKVAYLYLKQLPFDTAIEKLRSGIRAYNAANGIVDTPTGGYHETMTRAWLQLVYTTLCQYGPAKSADSFFDDQPQLGEKRVLRLFYSRDVLMSPEAKVTFVPPDLAPLPQPRDPKERSG